MKLKRIGFSRYIKRNWLDQTALTLSKHEDRNDAREYLEAWFVTEDLGKEAQRKTIDVLTRIWIRVPKDQIEFRDIAGSLFPKVTKEDRLWLHWGMMLVAYPIFRDVSHIMGRLLSLQGEVTPGQVKRGIFSEWGDRNTLIRSVERILQSMEEWNVINPLEGVKGYKINDRLTTENLDICLWITEALLRAENKLGTSIREIVKHPSLYPFDLKLNLQEVKACKRFEVYVQGLDKQTIRLRK